MSQNNPSDKNGDTISPLTENSPATEKEDIQWAYSGKAMRAQCILYWIITILFFGGGIYLTAIGSNAYLWAWSGIAVITACLWLHFFAAYFYRTWTIRYKLTNHRLYSYEGFFTKTSDSMELVYIEDIQLVQTLFDRIFNGGIGRLVIFSSADKTHNKLILMGIENPQFIFEKVDTTRAEVRAKRAIISGS